MSWRDRYEVVREFSGGLAAVKREGKWGFVNGYGQEIVRCRYDEVRDFEEAGIRNYMAAVRRGDRWGFVNKEGKEVVPFRYEEVRGFFWGVAAVKRNGKWGFVNEEGHEVVRCQYGETELVIIMAAKAVGMFLYGR